MNKNLAWLFFAAGIGVAAWGLFSGDGTEPDNSYSTIPAGGSHGGYVNNTGAAVYLTATGDILNGIGDVLANINTIVQTTQGGGGNNAPADDTSGSGGTAMAGRWSTGYM